MPSISIVIINWNGENVLENCLRSIYNNSVLPDEVIVVDNNSTDNSMQLLEEYKEVIIAQNSSNKGFSGGFNSGFPFVTSDYCFLLNNDTELASNCLEEIQKALSVHPEAGMFSLQIRLNEEEIDSLGVGVALDGMSKQIAHKVKVTDAQKFYRDEALPSGCGAVYKSEMLREIGLFDERFFAYCEDTDLALRALNYGWKGYLIPDAVLYHLHSHSHGKYSLGKIFYVERNHYFVAIKNFPLALVLLLPITTLVRFIVQTFSVIRNPDMRNFLDSEDGSPILVTFKAIVSMIKHLPEMFEGRKKNVNKSISYQNNVIQKHGISFSSLFR
ncbi:MAG: glycosyltransferase family 2 protein [Nitrospinae bacterium]|nr:glycosyltransferase family 2 protein [Nitrospinota bacterium]